MGSAGVGHGDEGAADTASRWLAWPDLKVALLRANEVICEQWRATTATVWHGGVRIAVEAIAVLREVSAPVI